ncbi:HIT domain-containing protein [Azospirillaceae bacterium]
MFDLHPRLEADTIGVCALSLSVVRLMNNRTWPWLVLVPARAGVVEIYQLSALDRATLMEEIALTSRVLAAEFNPDKINVGALGNLVPQLHVHVLGRFRGDSAWPGPVWGSGVSAPWSTEEAVALSMRLGAALGGGH